MSMAVSICVRVCGMRNMSTLKTFCDDRIATKTICMRACMLLLLLLFVRPAKVNDDADDEHKRACALEYENAPASLVRREYVCY